MNKPFVKIAIELLLLALAVYLGYQAFHTVQKTVDFKSQREARELVAQQRLMDIQTLEKEYFSQFHVYQDTFEVLKQFYLEGEIGIVFQNGSNTDTAALLVTEKLKEQIIKDYARRRIVFKKGEGERKEDSLNISLYRDYYLKDTLKYKDLHFTVSIPRPVRDTLFRGREDFCIDSLEYIPFSGGKKIVFWASQESDITGETLSTYEIKIPYEDLLTGLDAKETAAWCKEREKFDDRFRFYSQKGEEMPTAVDTTKSPDQRPGLQIGGDYQFGNGTGNWK